MIDLMDSVAKKLSDSGEINRAFVAGVSIDELVNKFGSQKVHDAMIGLVNDVTEACEALKEHASKIADMHSIMSRGL